MGENLISSLIQQFTKELTCFICNKKSVNPKIMPCCGEIGCEKCIQELLQTTKICPKCNHKNKKNSAPIQLHVLNTVIELLPYFSHTYAETNLCKKHSKQISFYCLTCNQSLCSSCIYDELYSNSKNHQNHEIKKTTEIVDTLKLQLQNELKSLVPIMKNIENSTHDFLNTQSKISSEKNSILIELHSKFREIQSKLEKKVKEADANLIQQINILKQKEEKAISLATQCEAILDSSNPQILKQASSIQKEIDEFHSDLPTSDQAIQIPDIQNELVPPFQMVRIEIPNFWKEQVKFSNSNDSQFLYSEKRLICGNKWRAKIYPNGNLSGRGTHLSVFVELVRGYKIPSKYYYRLEIESQKPHVNNLVRQYSSIFEYEDSWGWNKAASLETIYQNGYLSQDGKLSLLLGIRPESYYQMYRDINWSISLMKNKIKKIQQKKQENVQKKNE